MDGTHLSAGLATLLLGVVVIGGLILIPLGFPGLWIMLGGALLHSILVPNSGIGAWTLVACTVLVLIAELLEFTLSARYTRKYGGSRRSSWGAIIGGFVGAILGFPVPIVGPVIGALLGSFVGAFVFELTVAREDRGNPTRVAFGALLGRALATAVKTGIGVGVAIWLMTAAGLS